jgi:hypothetical protein
MSSTKFYSPGGPANVRRDLDGLLCDGTDSLRIAVCFFTDAGRALLERHSAKLQLEHSYFVASIDWPTNLKSMERLHWSAPGHVYIHLGGVTPEEKRVGRSLMHSKVVLAENGESCRLWVGSHNLTAMAIEGGNFEAATMMSESTSSHVIQDAIAHLELCRSTAELFDPNDMDRYREIQRRRCEPDWDSERNVLVIHAEAAVLPTESAFIARVQIAPTELDGLIRNDRPVRLFLHSPGTLTAGTLVDYRKSVMWIGEITAVVRTELHPRHRGAKGDFSAANYDIDVRDLSTIPVLRPGGHSTVAPKTQIVISLDRRGEPGTEMYSIGPKSPASVELDSVSEQELHEIDADMVNFFTPESIRDGQLIYRPVDDIRQEFTVRGFAETVRSRLDPDELRATLKLGQSGFNEDTIGSTTRRRRPRRPPQIKYEFVESTRPIDPFFYLSGYAIRSK